MVQFPLHSEEQWWWHCIHADRTWELQRYYTTYITVAECLIVGHTIITVAVVSVFAYNRYSMRADIWNMCRPFIVIIWERHLCSELAPPEVNSQLRPGLRHTSSSPTIPPSNTFATSSSLALSSRNTEQLRAVAQYNISRLVSNNLINELITSVFQTADNRW